MNKYINTVYYRESEHVCCERQWREKNWSSLYK